MIITGISEILSSSLRNALVTIFLFWVCQAIHWSISSNILFPNLNTSASWRISQVIMAYIVSLAETFIHPTLISTTHILITVLLVSRMVVHVLLGIPILGTTTHYLSMCLISWTTVEFCSFLLLEVALFSELVVWVIFRVLNIQFSFILWLFNTRLCVDGREGYVLVLRVESKQRNCPVTALIIPAGLIVQLV